MRFILALLVCSSTVFAQVDSVFTKEELLTGEVVWAAYYSLFLLNDTSKQIAIPTNKIEKLVLRSGEVVIGPGVSIRKYYNYLGTFTNFPVGRPDSLRAKFPAPGTASAMAERSNSGIADAVLMASAQGEDVMDIDGNTYRTVKIGSQTWMAENLRVEHYRDGTLIPVLTNNTDWTATETGALSIYDQNDSYGILYNWQALTDTRGIAPAGWHVPSDSEWIVLEETLGMSSFEAQQSGAFRGSDEGGKLSGSREHWEHGELTENHLFGSTAFKALPGGYRGYLNGTFSGWGNSAYFWSSSATNSGSAWYRSLRYDRSGIIRDHASKQVGFAIRCIKDLPGDDPPIDYTRSSQDDLKGYELAVVDRRVSTQMYKGMTIEMARLSLGDPEKINRTEYNFTIYERWVYPGGRCLFFESGLLQSWEEENF